MQRAYAGCWEKWVKAAMINDTGFHATLRSEFDAEEGSFLLQLRCDLVWDKAAFSRLIAAMEACAAAYEGEDCLPRWIAQGFWYLGSFVQDWSTHPNFPQEHSPDYYQDAYERFYELAYWLFQGESPSMKTLPPL